MTSFVIFGNLERPFHRMATSIEENLAMFPKPLVIQAGANIEVFSNIPSDVEVFSLCPFKQFDEIVRGSTVIVTHGGVGSIKSAVLTGKRPAVFVRCGSLGEHIDDHQVEFCASVFRAGLAVEIHDSEGLNRFLARGRFALEDGAAGSTFFDDSKLRDEVQAYIRQHIVSQAK